MEFTFCAFTYNQRDLITLQLESIKYQIEHYGKRDDCYFLLADDHSTDGTVDIVEKWIVENQGVFKGVQLIVANRNRGIVRNYESALKNIHTEHFHITAGDDFYYKNDVIHLFDERYNMIISPVLYLLEDNSVGDGYYRFIQRLLACGSNSEAIKDFILGQYKYGVGLSAPGVFFKKTIVDEGLFDVLSHYKWIEDVPEFFYLLSQPNTKVKVICDPLVVYRAETGVSHKPRSEEYLADAAQINNTIHVRKIKSVNKYVNPFTYTKAIECGINKFNGWIVPERRKLLKDFKVTIRKEKAEAGDYIREIINASKEY